MEKKTQAISSPKSPASKMSSASSSTSNPQSNGTINDDTYQVKDDTTNGHSDTSKPPCSSEPELTHPIISVDIKKTIPSDSKQASDAADVTSNDAAIRKQTETVASVVTNAVVCEATIVVNKSGTDSVKLTSDHKNVDERVQEELNRIEETSAKPVLNGDLNHSPRSKNISPTSPEEPAIKGTEPNISDAGAEEALNGVAGIIVVETISKKDIASDNHETEVAEVADEVKGESNISTSSETKNAETEDAKMEDPTQQGAAAEDNKEAESIVKINDRNSPDNKDDGDSGSNSQKMDVLMSGDKPKTDNVTDAAKLMDISADERNLNVTDFAKLSGKLISDAPAEDSNTNADANTGRTDTAAPESNVPVESKDEALQNINVSNEKVVDAIQTEKDLLTNGGNECVEKTESSVTKDLKSGVEEASAGAGTVGDARAVTQESCAKESDTESDVSKDIPSESKADSAKFEKDEKTETKSSGSVDGTSMTSASAIIPKDSSTANADNARPRKSEESLEAENGAASKGVDKVSCRSAAAAAEGKSPETCDVAVGLDEVRMVRVASGDGYLEEIDGQQSTVEVEVADDSLPTNPEEADLMEPVTDDGHSSPLSSHSASSTKTFSATSKPSSAISVDNQSADVKPTSAVSRSSIPEPVVYEPPERRKSAVSAVSEADSKDTKKTDDEGGSEKDANDEEAEKQSSAAHEEPGEDSKEPENAEDKPAESTSVDEHKADDAETTEATTDEKTEQTAQASEAEVPDESTDAKDVDATSEDQETADASEVTHESSGHEADTKNETEEKTASEETKEEKNTDDVDAADVESAETKEEGDDAGGSGIQGTDVATDKDDVVKEVGVDEAETPEPEAKNAAGEVILRAQEEPETLLGESSFEKEAATPEDKEADDTEKEGESSKEQQEQDVDDGEKEKEETDDAVEDSAKDGEESKRVETETPAEAGIAEDGAKEDDKAKEAEDLAAETEEKDEAQNPVDEEKKDEEEKMDQEAENETHDEEKGEKEDVKADEKDEKEDQVGKKEEDGEEKEGEGEEKEKEGEDKEKEGEGEEKEEQGEKTEKKRSPKSPTKRIRSPDKLGRRGVSPLSSPPKPIKAPTSPQKPQKTPSPKKKNGMLSPIKTPKTPGSDIRKLPPIKAPVGLAPNPNLKNIRSKIGSFDNIRYKPGGGDKKVISKKLEWKATPKIGSLDYSNFKGGDKKKERSKSESKETKSPTGSGDEAEAEAETETEGATAGAAADILTNPDETSSVDTAAVAIAAES